MSIDKAARDKAVKSLRDALNEAHAAGLAGGVFDGTFCVWPISETHPFEGTDRHDFFVRVERRGGYVISSAMSLDGGAGN